MAELKQPKTLNFQSLEQSLTKPGEFLLSDYAKFDRPPQIHIGFQSLDAFYAEKGRMPGPGSEEDFSVLLDLATGVNAKAGDAKVECLDERVLKHLANGASADLNPMAAMFGGIVGQEVVKACSGKFHPLFQVGNTLTIMIVAR